MTVTPPAHPTLGTPEKTYPYTDRDGQVLFYVCRFKTEDGKTFRQGHPNGKGWEWSLNGIEPVLYHLPALWTHLTQGARSPIWIVEGEKDADALAALGETATCNPMGAGKWRDEFTEILTGARKVCIVADLDDTGDKHARHIYNAIRDVVDEVTILHAPETLGKGADISDLLEEGYELDSLVTVDVTDQALIEGDEDAGARLAIQDIQAFAAVDEPSAEPILGDEGTTLLSMGGMLVLYGDGGAGKTTLELDLVMHLASGTSWQGINVHGQPRILIVENEGPRGMFRKKARAKLAAWDGQSVDERIYVLEDPWAVFSFAQEGYRDQLRNTIIEHEIDIVAAGPVNRLGISGGGTPEEVGAFILNIELIRQQLPRPLAVIFAHHENKAGDVSGAWEGVPDTLAHVQAQGNGHTRLHWQKVRWGPELHGKTWNLLWRDGEAFEIDETAVATEDELQQRLDDYLEAHPWDATKAIIDTVTGNPDRLRSLLKTGVETGRYSQDKGRRGAILYALSSEVPPTYHLDTSGTSDPDADIPFG